MSAELNELRILASRLEAESKDANINLEQYKDRVNELQRDIEDQKAQIDSLKHAEKREKEEEKERRKEAMLEEMMAKIDLVSPEVFRNDACCLAMLSFNTTDSFRVARLSMLQAKSCVICLSRSTSRNTLRAWMSG